jgi:hypothetical protein
MSTQDLGTIYSQERQPIVGVAFFLLPLRKGKIDFLKLREKLEGRCDIEELYVENPEKDVEEGDELYVPEVFKDKETKRVVLRTSVDKVILTGSSLFGRATLDRPITLRYRGYRILIIATTEIHFLILEDVKTKRHYLAILGSRANSKSLFVTLNRFLKKIGLFAVTAKLDSEKIDVVREQLKGELIDTTLDKFPTPKIRMKRIVGRGFQDEPMYTQDASISSVHQHMFEFKSGDKGRPKVVTLSEDALIRFYSSTTYKDYEWFLRNHIFPLLRQIKKVPSAPIDAYAVPSDIFKVEEEENG